MNTCPHPIDAAVLADYWLALLPPADEESVELHLFACTPCCARLSSVQSMIEAVRHIASQGSLRMIVSDEFIERVTAAGARVRQYASSPGGIVQCTVTAEDDFLIARLAANTANDSKFDLSLCDATGAEQLRLVDIPLRPGAGTVVYQESVTWAKSSPSNTMIARLLARDPAGAERLLGEYTFHHTRTIPD